MDIRSGCGYPSSALSNFAGHRFEFRGVQCNSMEGFLQSLKFKSPEMQVEVCKLIGIRAKSKGKRKNWTDKQVLYWQGIQIPRRSDEYQELLDEAYLCMAKQSKSFQRALVASGKSSLTHSIGRKNNRETILTVSEFCSRLVKLRDRLNSGEIERIR